MLARIAGIDGVAHEPSGSPAGVVVLTHGAGGDKDSPMLVAVCGEWARQGWLAVRYNLPYRRRRPTGPPPGSAAADQAGVIEAITLARELAGALGGGPGGRPVIAGGHSYGGRLTSMAVAGDPATAPAAASAGEPAAAPDPDPAVAGLTLFSYPLHPPGRPDRPRTAHLGAIAVPTVFVHGSRDPFGSIGELRSAAALIPAPTEIVEISGARHDLRSKVTDVPALAVAAALRLCGDG